MNRRDFYVCVGCAAAIIPLVVLTAHLLAAGAIGWGALCGFSAYGVIRVLLDLATNSDL
jgi:hypothetical protein